MTADILNSDCLAPILYRHICREKKIRDVQDIDIMQFTCKALTSDVEPLLIRPKVLLISDIDDFECDNIGRLLLENNITYARINAKYIPADFSFSINLGVDSPSCVVTSGSQRFECDDVKVVILRNFNLNNYQTHTNEVVNAIQQQEWNASILSFFSILNAHFINRPEVERQLGSVSFQLEQAKQHGFIIPRTLITSEVSEIRDFIGDYPERYLIKAIGLHHAIVNGIRYSYFSTRLDQISESLFEGCSTPLLVQEIVPNIFDLRVTFIREDFFFTKIERSTKDPDFIDYHYFKLDGLVYSEIQVEPSFEKKCRSFTKAIGLFYGAIDFVCTDNIQFIFLEINSNPDWQWLEKAHKRSISKAFLENIIDFCNG